MQKKHPWRSPIDMRTRLAMRDHANPATSQAVDAAYRLEISSPGYGRDYRYNGVSLGLIANQTTDNNY